MIMNKTDLVNVIAEKTDLSKNEVELVVDEFLQLIEEGILKEKEVKLSNFGVFYNKKRLARKGTNPSDGSPIVIPANSTVGFRPSKTLKEKLN